MLLLLCSVGIQLWTRGELGLWRQYIDDFPYDAPLKLSIWCSGRPDFFTFLWLCSMFLCLQRTGCCQSHVRLPQYGVWLWLWLMLLLLLLFLLFLSVLFFLLLLLLMLFKLLLPLTLPLMLLRMFLHIPVVAGSLFLLLFGDSSLCYA